tara:strand:+ start:1749 stop:2963 length:1215 start_codon:yes stop_codon:yes gene_type:complete
MANTKISDLTELTTTANDDLLVIVDTSTSTTKKIQVQNLPAGSGGGVSSVTGTAPIVSSEGTTPAISITAATGHAAGSMSAADKTKLDAIEANADVTDATNVASAGALMASSAQLTGNLDCQTNVISTTTSNGNVKVAASGTGVLEVRGNVGGGSDDNPGAIKLNCAQNSHGITIKSPAHSEGASYTLTLPSNDGDADQVLKTDGSGNLSWTAQGGSTPTLIAHAGGRIQVGGADDQSANHLILAGSLGMHYYAWATDVFSGANSITDAGTPGTSTFSSGIGYNIANGLVRVPKAGTISISGVHENPSASETRGTTIYYYVWKIGSDEVTAITNGTYDSAWTGTLVASTSVTVPSSNENIIPLRLHSTNGVSVAANDYVFATALFTYTGVTTRYFPMNYQLFVT